MAVDLSLNKAGHASNQVMFPAFYVFRLADAPLPLVAAGTVAEKDEHLRSRVRLPVDGELPPRALT